MRALALAPRFFIGYCQFLSALFVSSKWHSMAYIYIRSSGFNVAHTRIHILFYQFGCTSHCSILVLDLAQYVERFSFTEFNFISFYSICTTYLCHFHYFIILYQFFRPVVCVFVKYWKYKIRIALVALWTLAIPFEHTQHTVVNNNNSRTLQNLQRTLNSDSNLS